MDRANHALARYLAASGRDVHLVAHRVWPDLARAAGRDGHHVPRPFGSHLLGAPLLARAASRLGAPARSVDAPPVQRRQYPLDRADLGALPSRRLRAAGRRRPRGAAVGRGRPARYLAQEAETHQRAPRRSSATARARPPTCAAATPSTRSRVQVVYYGVDPGEFSAVTAEARRDARRRWAGRGDRRVAVFIGALGDRRKGFDVLFDAWQRLCADARGTRSRWSSASAPRPTPGSGAPPPPASPRAFVPPLPIGHPARPRGRRRAGASLALRGLRAGRARGALPRAAGDRLGERRRRRAAADDLPAADAPRAAARRRSGRAPPAWRGDMAAWRARAARPETRSAAAPGITWPRTSPRSSSET